MKTILTGNEAIEAYEQIQDTGSGRKCGYFVSDDCDRTNHWDKGTIVAFDNTTSWEYEEVFSTVDEAIDWINK